MRFDEYEKRYAALYAEFADDDRRLAEEGIEDYERGLVGEDARWVTQGGLVRRVINI